MDCYTDATYSDVIEYISALTAKGYTKSELSEPNGNIFATLLDEKSKGLLHISYLKHDKSLKIITDPLIESIYKTAEPSYTKITDTSFAVIPLDYTHRELTDGHGMCYIITLEDGRFIIIDGGYGDYLAGETKKEPRDSEIIYNYLKSNNKRDGGITVAAWIFTHPHADHYSAFIKFNELYRDIKIEYFIYNNGDPSAYSSVYPSDDFLRLTLPSIITRDYPTSKIIKPHAGQEIRFCNLTLNVIYTQELCIPYFEPATNDASTVFRITVNGSSILIMADCDCGASDLITDIYQSTLKSDFMQVNHHGYSGATVKLYDCVSPSYTLWTTSNAAFALRTTGKKYQFIGNAVESNKYIFDKLGREHCIVADGDVKHIIFSQNGYTVK